VHAASGLLSARPRAIGARSARRAAPVAEAPLVEIAAAAPASTTFVCEPDGSCAPVPCASDGCPVGLHVRLEDEWFDLTGWRAAHPAGGLWLDYFDKRDATEVMHAFHSDKARLMFQRLPKSPPAAALALEAQAAPVTPVMRAFRELRIQLEKDGWWKRDVKHEVTLLVLWAFTYGLGLGLVRSVSAPLRYAGTATLAVANTQTGWIAHDYIHGVDAWSRRLRLMGPLFGGMAPLWWSDKHNKHHALTNEVGVDEDIATDPFLFVFPPAPASDNKWRKWQHYTVGLPFSALFAIWRFDSIKTIYQELFGGGKPGFAQNDDVAKQTAKQKGVSAKKPKARASARAEGACLAVHWAGVFALVPKHIIPQYILLSGLLTAIIVTATHQSEEMFENFNADFVDNQFRTTRDATTRTRFTQWLWGGMQYQVEHHLFPTMPRSKYPALRPILEKFASDHKIPGGLRVSDEFHLVKLNWDTYRTVAAAPANPHAPPTRGRIGQAAIA